MNILNANMLNIVQKVKNLKCNSNPQFMELTTDTKCKIDNIKIDNITS